MICDQCGNVIESRDDSLVALLASNAEKHVLRCDVRRTPLAAHISSICLVSLLSKTITITVGL
ncbi:hypothetical protein B2J68_19875 [Vibrio cholerae]|nr:hypothetical protein B2J68_19875 [Vibrio cholerae]